jgi:ribonuclease P protein component
MLILKKRADFLHIGAQGRRFHTPRMSLQIMTLQTLATPVVSSQNGEDAIEAKQAVVVGFTVTKKVGNACVRNRVRRRLKAAATQYFANYQGAPLRIVVIGRIEALTAPFEQFQQDFAAGIASLSRPASARAPSGYSTKKRGFAVKLPPQPVPPQPPHSASASLVFAE